MSRFAPKALFAVGLFAVVVSSQSIPASAQSAASLAVSPLFGVGQAQGVVGRLADSAPVLVDRTWFLGAALEASYGNLPFRVRIGATRTLGGQLLTASGTESCGPNCVRFLRSPIGGATMTTVWGDAVLAPTSWWRTVAPYGFVGGALRVASYSLDRGMEAGFDGQEGSTPLRYGLGVDLRIWGQSELWIEWAHFREMGKSAQPGFTTGPNDQLAAGWRLSLF